MIINNNIVALRAHRMLEDSRTRAAQAATKLSSGHRIVGANDDAAGLAISEKMRGQIRGLRQAARNAQDGISLIQVAEGALNEVHSHLQRLRELAVQAAHDTCTGSDRIMIQQEVNQLTLDINRIGSTTEFNRIRVLQSGDESSNVSCSPAAVVWEKDIERFDLDHTVISPSGHLVLTAGSPWTGNDETTMKVWDMNGGDLVYEFDGPRWTNSVAFLEHKGLIFASAGSYLELWDYVEGEQVKGIEAPSWWDPQAFILGAVSQNAKYVAGGYRTLEIWDVDSGERIEFEHSTFHYLDFSPDERTLAYSDFGELGFIDLETGVKKAQYLEFWILDIKYSGDGSMIAVTGSLGGRNLVRILDVETMDVIMDHYVDDAVQTMSFGPDGDFFVFSDGQVDKLDISSGEVTDVFLVGAGGYHRSASISSDGSRLAVVDNGRLQVWALNRSFARELFRPQIHIGANSKQSMTIEMGPIDAVNLGIGLDALAYYSEDVDEAQYARLTQPSDDPHDFLFFLNVSTQEYASKSIELFDEAITKVSAQRSSLGSYQNRLEHAIRSLQNTAENLQAAESRIRDVDIADEIMVFTKSSILQQAATAMLAQANMAPQSVLQLLG